MNVRQVRVKMEELVLMAPIRIVVIAMPGIQETIVKQVIFAYIIVIQFRISPVPFKVLGSIECKISELQKHNSDFQRSKSSCRHR